VEVSTRGARQCITIDTGSAIYCAAMITSQLCMCGMAVGVSWINN
jgi:hypothetical protein